MKECRMTPVRLERENGLAVVTLDNPPLNLFDVPLLETLAEAVAAVESEPARALLVRAEGKVVSGGVDVAVFDGLTPAEAAALWRRLLSLVHRIEELPFPTVFAAHALTLTAALEIALACDILVATRSARFAFAETVVGLTPSMGGTQRIAGRAGPARAREMVLTGDLYDASTLEGWGVVGKVWDDEGFDERARSLAARLAAGPTLAHVATKRIVRAFEEGGIRAADEVVPEVSGALFATEDLQGAVRSFLEHGPGHTPVYRGR
jgi:enoyl-CoA hydratase/carnithine racemase